MKSSNGNETKSGIFSMGHVQIGRHIFFIKKYLSISMTSKNKISLFLTIVNPNNGDKTKPDIFSWDIFKSDIIFHWSQNNKVFQ